MRRKFLKADLARALGLSRSSVTKLAKRGMPTHSVDAATEWRRRNLDPSWTKPTAPAWQPAPIKRPAAIGYDVAPDGLPFTAEMLERLRADIAFFAECCEGDFDKWVTPLRVAMQLLPARYWNDVALPMELWNKLVGEDVLRALEESEATLTQDERATPIEARDRFVVDNFYYMAAAGMVRVDVDAIARETAERKAALKR
jgi:hypothetical protein